MFEFYVSCKKLFVNKNQCKISVIPCFFLNFPLFYFSCFAGCPCLLLKYQTRMVSNSHTVSFTIFDVGHYVFWDFCKVFH